MGSHLFIPTGGTRPFEVALVSESSQKLPLTADEECQEAPTRAPGETRST